MAQQRSTWWALAGGRAGAEGEVSGGKMEQDLALPEQASC